MTIVLVCFISISIMHCWLSSWDRVSWFLSGLWVFKIFLSFRLTSYQKYFACSFLLYNLVLLLTIRTFVLAKSIEKLCEISKELNGGWCWVTNCWFGPLCELTILRFYSINSFNFSFAWSNFLFMFFSLSLTFTFFF